MEDASSQVGHGTEVGGKGRWGESGSLVWHKVQWSVERRPCRGITRGSGGSRDVSGVSDIDKREGAFSLPFAFGDFLLFDGIPTAKPVFSSSPSMFWV